MLKIYDPEDVANVIPFPIEDDKRYVTHRYNGFDVLTFEIQSDNPLYKHIAEEVLIEDENNRFVVKNIDEHSDFVTVVCDIDLDDWKRDLIYEFRTTNKLLVEVLDMIVPAGWSVIGAGAITKRTTVENTEGEPLRAATPLEVLDKASAAYSCVFNFDVPNKVLSVIRPETFKPSGQFFTDELNLRSLGFVGSSEGFATRLYAYGKKDDQGNPLTFASINDGKPYVEDHSYSSKIVSIGWSDERYTNAEALLKDATERLRLVSHPSRSYECDAQNLQEDVWLYKVVTLIDRRRQTRVDHQIVEYKEYPNHALDTISLSKTAPDIKSLVSKVDGLRDEFEQESAGMKNVIQESIDHATAQITGNKGGHFVWVFDSEGKPIELLNLCDSTDLNSAKSVWRWNAAGLGHSNNGYMGDMTLALLADGSINASAITTGILYGLLFKAGLIESLTGKIKIDLGSETDAAVFNTGISTNGLTVRADEADVPNLFEVAVQKTQNGTYTAKIKLRDGADKLLFSLTEQYNASDGSPVGVYTEFMSPGKDSYVIGDLQDFKEGTINRSEIAFGNKKGALIKLILSEDEGTLQCDSLDPTDNGNCSWKYLSSLGETVLVKNS